MKYKLGDFVRFVDEKMEGYVTRIFDEQMIGVTGKDDFEIPVLAGKVTSVHGRDEQTNGEEPKASGPKGPFVKKGVHLAVISEQRAGSVVNFHIVNETFFQLFFTLITDRQQQYHGEFAGMIDAGRAAKVYTAKLSDIELWPKFKFSLLYYTTQDVEPLEPLVINEKFKAKDFSGAKKTVPIINQPGWLIRLDEPELSIDPQKLKESFFKPAEQKQELARPPIEIDLHIEKLRDDFHFLSSAQILSFQLNHFSKMLDAAIVHQMPDITFIHGTGNGILKHELHKKLSKNNKVQTFMDARKEKFGYGATKVILK